VFIWGLFKTWIYVFFVSFTSWSTIWIIVPIWLNWFFAEFFQEKKGTSFGNAISNGAVPLWVGIDWMRQLTMDIIKLHAKFTFLVFSKYLISVLAIVYGLIIIVYGIRGKSFVRYVGRIREISYVLAVLTPLVYGLIKPNFEYFLAVILFFPLFYYLIELIDKLTPEPVIYAKEKEEIMRFKEFEPPLSGESKSFGVEKPPFGRL
jgi:hypothetical protein